MQCCQLAENSAAEHESGRVVKNAGKFAAKFFGDFSKTGRTFLM
jgi:hypothetical protein